MITQLITLFILFGLPFLVVPTGQSQFEVPKVVASILFISVLALIQACQFLARPSLTGLSKGWPIAIFLTLTGLAVYQLFYSSFPDHLLLGNAWRPQGTIPYLSLLLLFLIAKQLPHNIALYNKLAYYSLIALFVLTLIIGPRESFRFIGTLGEPTALGATVLFLFPFTTTFNNKRQQTVALVLSVLLVLITGSRGILLGFAAECTILLLLRRHTLFILASLTIAVAYILSFVIPFLPRDLPQEYFLRFESRAEVWSIAAKTGSDSPWTGTGFGSVQDAIRYKSEATKDFTRFQPIDHAHNLFLNWWVMGGFIGLVALIVLIALSIKNMIAAKSWVLLSILFGLIIAQSFNPVSITTLVHFWWLLGISSKEPIV